MFILHTQQIIELTHQLVLQSISVQLHGTDKTKQQINSTYSKTLFFPVDGRVFNKVRRQLKSIGPCQFLIKLIMFNCL